MGKFFKKALAGLLTAALVYGNLPFNSYMAGYAQAAVEKTADKNVSVPEIKAKPVSKILYIGWKEKKKSTSIKVTYKNVQKKGVSFKSSTADNSAVTFTATPGAVNASVTRGSGDINVGLTATISKGNSSDTSEFNILVKEDVLEISKIVQGDFIKLPQEFAGNSIKWTSSDTSVITGDGIVTPPATGYKSVIMEAETGGVKQSHEVIVLPARAVTSGAAEENANILYKEDYSNMVNDAMIATTWISKDKQNCLYAEADNTHDSFIKFAAGNTGSSQGTEFAITGRDAVYIDGDTNAGIGSSYILKLSADNSTTWQINNDTEKICVLPLGWVHIKAIIDSSSNKAAIIISDAEDIYFAGEVNINGEGKPGGLYLKWGCVQALVSVDNVKVTS